MTYRILMALTTIYFLSGCSSYYSGVPTGHYVGTNIYFDVVQDGSYLNVENFYCSMGEDEGSISILIAATLTSPEWTYTDSYGWKITGKFSGTECTGSTVYSTYDTYTTSWAAYKQ